MGTRHLIAVQLDGQYRIAQYGQWDGYVTGQGATVLEFLTDMDRQAFEVKLRASRLLTSEELAALSDKFKSEGIDWAHAYPHISRDAGAEILDMVSRAPDGIQLKNSIDFAADSIFCEYAYVIDLDKNTLEVFRGFNKEPLSDGERFYGAKHEGQDGQKSYDGESTYYPVRLKACYSLDKLPTLDRMGADIDPPEEDEEAQATSEAG